VDEEGAAPGAQQRQRQPHRRPESEAIVFAGNFYGGHVGLTMDLLKITAATVATSATASWRS